MSADMSDITDDRELSHALWLLSLVLKEVADNAELDIDEAEIDEPGLDEAEEEE